MRLTKKKINYWGYIIPYLIIVCVGDCLVSLILKRVIPELFFIDIFAGIISIINVHLIYKQHYRIPIFLKTGLYSLLIVIIPPFNYQAITYRVLFGSLFTKIADVIVDYESKIEHKKINKEEKFLESIGDIVGDQNGRIFVLLSLIPGKKFSLICSLIVISGIFFLTKTPEISLLIGAMFYQALTEFEIKSTMIILIGVLGVYKLCMDQKEIGLSVFFILFPVLFDEQYQQPLIKMIGLIGPIDMYYTLMDYGEALLTLEGVLPKSQQYILEKEDITGNYIKSVSKYLIAIIFFIPTGVSKMILFENIGTLLIIIQVIVISIIIFYTLKYQEINPFIANLSAVSLGTLIGAYSLTIPLPKEKLLTIVIMDIFGNLYGAFADNYKKYHEESEEITKSQYNFIIYMDLIGDLNKRYS